MNGLTTLSHIAKKIGSGQCDLNRAECGTRSNGMVIIRKSQEFGEGIRNWEKGNFKPCLNCLNEAHAQGRIKDATYAKGLEIRGRA